MYTNERLIHLLQHLIICCGYHSGHHFSIIISLRTLTCQVSNELLSVGPLSKLPLAFNGYGYKWDMWLKYLTILYKLLKNVSFSLMFACHMMGYWFDTFILSGRILHFTHHPIIIKVDESSYWRTIRTCICIESMCDICGISLMRMQKCYSSYMDGLLANSLWLIA